MDLDNPTNNDNEMDMMTRMEVFTNEIIAKHTAVGQYRVARFLRTIADIDLVFGKSNTVDYIQDVLNQFSNTLDNLPIDENVRFGFITQLSTYFQICQSPASVQTLMPIIIAFLNDIVTGIQENTPTKNDETS